MLDWRKDGRFRIKGEPMPKGKQFWSKSSVPAGTPHIVSAQKAYHMTKCSICGARALYRAGKRVFCKAHKQIASDWWAKHPMRVKLDYDGYREEW
jgi:hypothetical protein